MAMSKYWTETWDRLDAIEAELKKLKKQPAQTAVTKEQLMDIQGVGSSTADKILDLINS